MFVKPNLSRVLSVLSLRETFSELHLPSMLFMVVDCFEVVKNVTFFITVPIKTAKKTSITPRAIAGAML